MVIGALLFGLCFFTGQSAYAQDPCEEYDPFIDDPYDPDCGPCFDDPYDPYCSPCNPEGYVYDSTNPDCQTQEGTGEISGQVLLPDETPVSYANVHGFNFDYAETDDEFLYQHAETDENGEFTLTGLSSGAWMVYAEPPYWDGYSESEWQEVEVTDNSVSLDEPLILYPDYSGGEIRGKVVITDLITRTPVPSAFVWAESENGEFAQTECNEAGEFVLSDLFADTWTVYAEPPEEGEQYLNYRESEGRIVEITDESVVLKIPMVLRDKPKGGIQGVINAEEGRFVEGAYIFAWIEGQDEFAETMSDVNGGFTLEGLVEGTWTVIAIPPDIGYENYDISDERDAEVAGNVMTLDSALILNQMTLLKVRGRVMIDENTPASGAHVYLFNYYYELVSDEVYTADDGTFEFYLEPDEYNLEVEFWDESGILITAEDSFILNDTDTDKVLDDILLTQEIRYIEGSVTDGTTPIFDAEVVAYNWETNEVKTGTTDEYGNFSIGVEDEGMWEIEVLQDENADWIRPIEPSYVEVTGESDIFKPLPLSVESSAGELTGQLLDPQDNPLSVTDCGASINAYNPATETYNFSCLKEDGTFSMPMGTGNYEIWFWLDPDQYPDYGAPPMEPIRFQGDMPLNPVRVLGRNAELKGEVRDQWGRSVSDISVEVWQPDGDWFGKKTDAEGKYHFKLAPGQWIVELFVPESSEYIFNGSSREVMLSEGKPANVSFKLGKAAGLINGRVVDESGEPLTDIFAWAYARREGTDSVDRVSETWVENGRFRLKVPRDNFRIGLDLPPESGYSLVQEESLGGLDVPRSGKEISTATAAIMDIYPYEQVIQVDDGDNKRELTSTDMDIMVQANNAFITGTLIGSDGQPVTGIEGYVFAAPAGGSGSWQEAEINSADGSFEIQVAQGITWHLTYELETADYVSSPLRPIPVPVTQGEEPTVQNITLIPLDKESLYSGQVKGPNDDYGMGDVEVWVRVSSREGGEVFFEDHATTDSDGNFSFSIPSTTASDSRQDYYGYYLCIYTAINMCGGNTNYCYMDAQADCRDQFLTRSLKQDGEMILKLREADTALEGRVLGQGGESPVENAFVSAYSADGQKTQGRTDINGKYSLQVARAESSSKGNLWTLRASYKSREDNSFYRSDPVQCDISGTEATVTADDITLKAVGSLPPVETHKFNVKTGWSRTLPNGDQIQIPANGVPTSDREVNIVVEPGVEMPSNAGDELINYGYVISVRDKNGKEIVKNFKKGKEVLMTFRYEDSQVTDKGVDEKNIRPAFFSETSHSWQPVKGFTIDTDTNKVTFRTDHLSTWALVAAKPSEISGTTTDPEPGDVNASGGSPDMKDAILALKACVNDLPSGVQITLKADVNGDDKIGVAEAIYILQKLATVTSR